jgi:glycine betaine/proline transport system ATP-binding protein
MRDDDRHLAVVLDNEQRFKGMVSVNSLIRAKESNHDWEQAFLSSVRSVTAEMALEEVLKRVVEEGYPVPVVDESDRYLGVIDKNILLKTFKKAG